MPIKESKVNNGFHGVALIFACVKNRSRNSGESGEGIKVL